MRFGCCLPGVSFVPQINEAYARENKGIREVDRMKEGVLTLIDAGCDFVEINVVAITQLSDEDFAEFRAFLKEREIVIETFCSFVPPEIPLVGQKEDRMTTMRYVQKALARCAACGAKVIVFGSGGARNCPDGFPREKAREQLIDFLRMCDDTSGAMGLLVRIAIEPLNATETNMVIGLEEGYDLWKAAKAAGCSYINLLADAYHMHMCNDDIGQIAGMSDALSHVHIADVGRALPGKAENGYDFKGFFAALKECGYEGRISVECPMGDLAADAKYCMDFALKTWDSISL